ncbi:MAG: hypothetical protein ACKOTA_09170, partial [Solirubrobacterales bacterium]
MSTQEAGARNTRGLTYAGGVGYAMWQRSLLELARVKGGLLPTTIAPIIFLLGTRPKGQGDPPERGDDAEGDRRQVEHHQAVDAAGQAGAQHQ